MHTYLSIKYNSNIDLTLLSVISVAIISFMYNLNLQLNCKKKGRISTVRGVIYSESEEGGMEKAKQKGVIKFIYYCIDCTVRQNTYKQVSEIFLAIYIQYTPKKKARLHYVHYT